jgi:hypothetical protein
MTSNRNQEATALIAELPLWNNGDGIDAEGWIGCTGSAELAIGYSLVFWPEFVRIKDYVVRAGCDNTDYLDEWERQCKGDHAAVEKVVNHLHIADLHAYGSPVTKDQARYLGRVLKNIHQVKLQADFPDLIFEVYFNDEADVEVGDYQLTFWQIANQQLGS